MHGEDAGQVRLAILDLLDKEAPEAGRALWADDRAGKLLGGQERLHWREKGPAHPWAGDPRQATFK